MHHVWNAAHFHIGLYSADETQPDSFARLCLKVQVTGGAINSRHLVAWSTDDQLTKRVPQVRATTGSFVDHDGIVAVGNRSGTWFHDQCPYEPLQHLVI